MTRRGSPRDQGGVRAVTAALHAAVAELQDKLYAQDRRALLLIFQAMDAAGKDGTIKHVMSGVNPQGCEVFSFKAPSTEELDHDIFGALPLPSAARPDRHLQSFLLRGSASGARPSRVAGGAYPGRLIGKKIWKQRFEDISAFERYLTRNGIAVRKFFLHFEQGTEKRAFWRVWRSRKRTGSSPPPTSASGGAGMITSRPTRNDSPHSGRHAPWFVVPADHKWFARMVVSFAVVDALKEMKLSYPKVSSEKRRSLAAARRELEGKTHFLKK